MSRRLRNLNILLTVSLLLTTSSALLAEGSWKSFRGNAGSGESSEPLPPGDGPLTLEIAWKKPLGSGYSGISISDGRMVTAYTDGETDFVVALDPATGDEIWRYELGPIYKGHDGSHDGPIATPAIADGKVFALDPAGRLAALDLETGSELWTGHLTEDLGSEAPYYGFASSPVIAGDLMILQAGGEDGSVAAFDVATGELRWRGLEDGVDAQSPILADIGGRQQVLVMGETKLAGLDPSSGAVLWEFEHEGDGPMGAMSQSPVPLGNNRIFVKYTDPSSAVVELSEVDGAFGAYRLNQSKGMARSYSPAVVSGDHVYGFTARFLSAVDPASGDLLWRSRDVGDGFIISVGGQLAVLQKTGTLHLGAASPEGWSETAQVQLFDDLAWTPPSYADGSFYLRSLGEIARVDLVRAPALVASAGSSEIPAALAPLAASLASTIDAASAVDEFLAGPRGADEPTRGHRSLVVGDPARSARSDQLPLLPRLQASRRPEP
jgi:outer membrane protein assembly factor BamB